MRLDRLVGRLGGIGHREVRGLLASGAVLVQGETVRDGQVEVGAFERVEVAGQVLQARRAVYLMLHKPPGYVSATVDEEHPTVLELVGDGFGGEVLHLAGRLDRFSSGLMLLTNDGGWSRRLTLPEAEFGKVYRVETARVIAPGTAEVFRRGIYFAYEDITTGPAELEVLGERLARLTIYEGKYHQVKRLFHAAGNRVVALHRERVGPITLDPALAAGEWRELTAEEVAGI